MTKLFPVLLTYLIVFLSGLQSYGRAAVRDHVITLDDYFTQAIINDVSVSPDGQYLAYIEMRWEPPAQKRNHDLWVVENKVPDARLAPSVRLTFDPATEASPQWSPDSRWIYFTANYKRDSDASAPYNGKTQVWRIQVGGGEPQAVTRLKDGIEEFHLSAKGTSLFYTVTSEDLNDEWRELREKHKGVEYGRGVVKHHELWRLDLGTWRSEKLVDEQRVIGRFAVSPDESRIAMITTPTEELITNEGWSRVDIYDIASRTVVTLDDSLWRKAAPSPYGWLEGLTWSADSRKLAFRVDFDGYPAEILVAFWTDANSQEPVIDKLKRPGEFSLGESPKFAWKGNSKDLCFVAQQRAYARVACIEDVRPGSQGRFTILTPGEVVAETFDLSQDGRTLAANLSDLTSPGDVYVKKLTESGSAARRLTRVNPQIDTWKIPQVQLVTWESADGRKIEGILELPPDYQPSDGPLPLHVALHGGPTMADYMRFEYWIYGRVLWPAMGWAVFCPNYRGSTGYGDQFITDLIGRENDIEVTDILSGVDALIARGIADSNKLAVSGWSNGGYLTNCLITKTTRFKAASSGAGVMDMAMQWSIEDTPGHVINYMRGFPWDKTDAYLSASPMYNLDRVRTPTLIHVGESDERVPAAHARALFRGLHHYLNVPAELVVYPDQGHGLSTVDFRRAKLEWDIAWFDRYVLGKQPEEPKKP